LKEKHYLQQMEKAADRLNGSTLSSLHLEVFTGVVLNSVALKLFDRSWASDADNAVSAEGRIFFSVWLGEESIKKSKVSYNIHAFKVRSLKNYKLTARAFASDFRARFKNLSGNWPNVSVDYGALTLMEGWCSYNDNSFVDTVVGLSESFFQIKPVIDEILLGYKKK